jgi:hypothetical protein
MLTAEPRPGRNDPCRCGSGRKYKRCCGDADARARRDEARLEAGIEPDEPEAPSSSPIPTDAEAEDHGEKAADELGPMLVRAFTTQELSKLHRLEFGLCTLWRRRGGPSIYTLGRALLSTKHELLGPLNLELSRRHVGGAKRNSCYWSAARALLTDPDLAGARYCEGIRVVNNVRGPRDRSRGLSGGHSFGIELEGFLRLPDDDVVDPVLLVNAAEPSSGTRSVDFLLESATYFALAEFSREEVADRWDEIPLSLTSRAGGARTYKALVQTIEAFAGAVQECSGRLV